MGPIKCATAEEMLMPAILKKKKVMKKDKEEVPKEDKNPGSSFSRGTGI